MWKNMLFLSLSGLLGHYVSPTTKQYHLVDQKMTWTDAQHHCREHFDDLATVDNPEELKQLQESRSGSDYDTDSMWIGLHDDITRWQWSHGNQDYIVGQHYGNWVANNPNNYDADQNCSHISPSGFLNDVPCSFKYSAVCFHDDGNYVYVQEKMTWYKAREYCQSNYMELASVRDATEEGKIVEMINADAWIGLHRYPWSHWSDGSNATYWNWRTDEPNNNQNKEHCVCMIVPSGYFVDIECGSLHYVACQERQKQPSTFRLKISSEAEMTDPEVQHQFVEQVSAELAKEGVTGVKLRWVLKKGQDQQSQE